MWKPWRIFVLSFALTFVLLVSAKQIFDGIFLTERISGTPNYNCKVCTTVPPSYSP